MLAGTFRDRIQIQHRTRTPKATGVTEVWTNVEIRWARVVPLSARARAEYAQIRSEVTHEVVFRERVEIVLGDDRLIWLTGESRVLELVVPPFYAEGLNAHTQVAVRPVVVT